MSNSNATLFVLTRKEYNQYMTEILSRRRIANEYLSHFLVVKQLDEWTSFYALLCEYIAILFRFEEILERATLVGTWSEEQKGWLLENKLATSAVLFASTEISCRHQLLDYNVSLSSH